MSNDEIIKFLDYNYLYEKHEESGENISIVVDAGDVDFGGSVYIDRFGYQPANSIVPEFISNKNIGQKDIKGKEYDKSILVDVDYIKYINYSDFKNNEQLKEVLNIGRDNPDEQKYYDHINSLRDFEDANGDADSKYNNRDYVDGVIVFRKDNVVYAITITQDDLDYWNNLIEVD